MCSVLALLLVDFVKWYFLRPDLPSSDSSGDMVSLLGRSTVLTLLVLL
jgi:hypothetical protein